MLVSHASMRRQLREFLTGSFGQDELRMFVQDHFADLLSQIPEDKSVMVQANRFIELLEHRGSVGRLWEPLRRERSSLLDEVCALEQQWNREHQAPGHTDRQGEPASTLARHADRPASPAPDQPRSRPRSSGDWLHAFGSSIDRTKQWHPMLEACRSNQSAFFLVHGHQRQWVELFTYRVWNYLNEECGRHHDFVSVPLRVEYATPRSAAAWINNVRVGIGAGASRIEEALSERTRHAPLFIILSEFPLEKGDLDEDELDALVDFLDSRLPAVITRVRPAHPIRVLLTTQYDGQEDESLVETLDKALHKAKAHGIHYPYFPPLQDVGWEDVRAFLMNRDPRPPQPVFDEVRRSFDELTRRDGLSFRELIERLGRKLF